MSFIGKVFFVLTCNRSHTTLHTLGSRMKLSPLLAVFLLVGLVATTPTSTGPNYVVVVEDYFIEPFVVYSSQHDIVSITVPLNALNFDDDTDENNKDGTESSISVFFVEADVNDKGERDYKGLYVLKDGKATKLLEHGTDSAAAHDDTKLVYFGAKDGLYVYNAVENKAEKYGSITDSIIKIAKENGTDSIYILTEDHVVYKVTDGGTKKIKIDNVNNAQDIALDSLNNLYYYGPDKRLHVVNDGDVKKIRDLPENLTYVSLMNPSFLIEQGVLFIANDKVYIIFASGVSGFTNIEFRVKPTASAPEATLLQYYAYNKKIYEYNILRILFGDLLDDLKFFLQAMSDTIQSIAKRSRSEMKP